MTETGTKVSVNVVVGDTVLLPEYGGQTLKLGDEELSLFRDEDILGKFQVLHWRCRAAQSCRASVNVEHFECTAAVCSC